MAELRPTGIAGFLGTGDHKALGRILIILSILVVAASEVLGVILRLDTVNTRDHQLLSAERSLSLSTLQPTGAVLVGLIPLLLGIALVVVPLQIGSRSLALPACRRGRRVGLLHGRHAADRLLLHVGWSWRQPSATPSSSGSSPSPCWSRRSC